MFRTSVISCIVALAATMPQYVVAATFMFASPATTVAVGSTVDVAVVLDGAAVEDINAVEGVLQYDASRLMLLDVSDGGSAITLWATSPVAALHREEDGTVPFSGITPGGIGEALGTPVNGLPAGTIFVATFRGKTAGDVTFAVAEPGAYVNDGLGTAAETQAVSFHMEVLEGTGQVDAVEYDDIIPPEEFVPIIAKDASTFEGKWFAVFQTTDKDSGIDYYTLQENGGEEVVAQSPYVLADQSGDAEVIVRAYDRAGNMREGIRTHGEFPTLAVCVILFAFVTLIIVWGRRRKQLTS